VRTPPMNKLCSATSSEAVQGRDARGPTGHGRGRVDLRFRFEGASSLGTFSRDFPAGAAPELPKVILLVITGMTIT
jgi:hypothetical protein